MMSLALVLLSMNLLGREVMDSVELVQVRAIHAEPIHFDSCNSRRVKLIDYPSQFHSFGGE